MKFIRDGEKDGKGVCRWGKREIIHLLLHCHHQNDSCIKGSDESHFNVPTIRFEPRSLCLPAYCLTARPNQLTSSVTGSGGIYIVYRTDNK